MVVVNLQVPATPMKVAIYNESAAGMLGGTEYMTAVLASSLVPHRVEVLHHHQDLTAATLGAFAGEDLSGVHMTELPRAHVMPPGGGRLWRISRDQRQWRADLSAGQDVFVPVLHTAPPFCHARRGVCYVNFPLFRPDQHWPLTDRPSGPLDVRRRFRNAWYQKLWNDRLSSYDVVVSNTRFARHWTREYWGVDSEIVHPPVNVTPHPPATKERRIISVGRFSAGGHPKCHQEMIEAFAMLSPCIRATWTYDSVGVRGTTSKDKEYFDRVARLARRHGVRLHPDIDRDELRRLYGVASIFVHAAGYGVPSDEPARFEHFGIATVEAMAAGCVPLVVNRGGQPEIVEHGISGMVWNSLDELAEQMRVLMADGDLRARLSAAAIQRAQRFSREKFSHEMRRLMQVGP